MTRLQDRQLREALQQSTSTATPPGPSSSSTGPESSASAFFKSTINALVHYGGGLPGTGEPSDTFGSETLTSYEDTLPHKGGQVEGMASTDDDRQRAIELSLGPEPSPAGFFDSSQEPSLPVGRSIAASDKIRPRQPTTVPEVVINTTRSTSSATPARLRELSESPANPITPGGAKKRKGSKSSRKDSVAPSEASTSVAGDVDEGRTSSGRSRRSAAKDKSYAPMWNADGTEMKFKDKKERGGSGKESKKSSSKTPQPSSGKGSQAEEPIVIDDEDDAEDEEEDEEEEEVLQTRKSKKSSNLNLSVTVTDDESDEDEDKIPARRAKVREEKAKKKRGRIADDEDAEMQSEDQEDRQTSTGSRGKAKGRRDEQSLLDADGEEEEKGETTPDCSMDEVNTEPLRAERTVPVVEVKTPVAKGRGGEKKSLKTGKAQSKQAAEVDEIEDEEIAAAESEKVAANDEKEDEEEEEDEVQRTRRSKGKASLTADKESKEKGSKGKSTVLADASSTVNAGRRGAKQAEAKSNSSSTSSTSTPAKPSLLDAAKRFWGKPLTSILGAGSHRSPGLAKRKIAPLLAHRGEPPPKRAAIPIPKSRQRNNDEELDSEEEAARANETPEERMARYIREQDEGY